MQNVHNVYRVATVGSGAGSGQPEDRTTETGDPEGKKVRKSERLPVGSSQLSVADSLSTGYGLLTTGSIKLQLLIKA